MKNQQAEKEFLLSFQGKSNKIAAPKSEKLVP